MSTLGHIPSEVALFLISCAALVRESGSSLSTNMVLIALVMTVATTLICSGSILTNILVSILTMLQVTDY